MASLSLATNLLAATTAPLSPAVADLVNSDSDDLLTIRFLIVWNRLWSQIKPDIMADSESVYNYKIQQCIKELDGTILSDSKLSEDDRQIYQQWREREITMKFQEKKYYSLTRRKKLQMSERMRMLDSLTSGGDVVQDTDS